MPHSKTLYLHIGLHKTGSSAIQIFLNNNRSALQTHGLNYLALQLDSFVGGTSGNGQQLFTALRTGNTEAAQRYAELVRQTTAPTVVISGEQLSLLKNEELSTLRELFADVCCKIIVYIRRQDQFITSLVNQRIGFWKQTTFRHDARFVMEAIDRYAAVFGKDNVLVRVYEKKQFEGGTIFSDFLHIFGLPLTDDYQLPLQANPPLGRDFLEIKRLCNALPFNHHLLRSELLPPLTELTAQFDHRDIFATPELLSPPERRAILDEYADFNAHVAQDFLGREDGRLFFAPEPCDDDPWQPYTGIPQETLVQTFFSFHLGLVQKMKEQTCRQQLDGKRLAVWGLGERYREYVAELLATHAPRAEIVCLVDSNPALRHTRLDGKPVLAPEELRSIDPEAIVIATIMEHAVRGELKELDLHHIPAYAL